MTIIRDAEDIVMNLFLGPRLQAGLDRFKLSQHVHADNRPIFDLKGTISRCSLLPSFNSR